MLDCIMPYFAVDLIISRFVQSISFPGFKESMTFLSNSGWGIPLFIFIATVIISLLILKKYLEAFFIVILSASHPVLFFVIANLINRPRPSPDLVRVDFAIKVGGFPSGHVLLYTLIFGYLIYITFLFVKNMTLKLLLIFIFSTLMFLMGVARIYSGQHWPTDILGGYILGGIWLSLIVKIYKKFKGPKLHV